MPCIIFFYYVEFMFWLINWSTHTTIIKSWQQCTTRAKCSQWMYAKMPQKHHHCTIVKVLNRPKSLLFVTYMVGMRDLTTITTVLPDCISSLKTIACVFVQQWGKEEHSQSWSSWFWSWHFSHSSKNGSHCLQQNSSYYCYLLVCLFFPENVCNASIELTL